MLTELEGKARVHFTFDITLPNTSGTTTLYQFAEKPTASESQGLYLPYALDLGSVARSTGFPTFGFQNPRTSVRIFDKERALQKAIGGPANGKVIGSLANVVMRSFDVASASHYTVMPGVVKDFNPSGEYEWNFVIGPDIEELESKLKIPRLEEMWEPKSIPQANREEPGRLIWGEWLSSGRSGVGEIKAVLVDTTLNDWFVCNGHLPDSSITNVFVDEVSDTANWTLQRLLQNGNPVSVIRDTGGTYTVSNKVSFDCTGLGDRGDADGGVDLIERIPSVALIITLSSFAFREWPTGATFGAVANSFKWFLASAAIDSVSFAAAKTYHELLNHEVDAVWTSDQTGLDIMGEYMDSFYLPVFFSDEFLLKIGLINFHERDIYTTDFIRKDEKEVADISGQSFGEDRVSRINISYMPDKVTGGFDRRFTAANEDLGYTRENDISYTIGGPSRVP